jgi:hypothetical protein
MEHIYIMACQRGQSSPEIFSIWNTYEKAITAYYKYHIDEDNLYKKTDNDTYWFMYLYKIPVGENFVEVSRKSSDVKLQKSCKYRIKFKTWGDLRKEYNIVNRDSKIESITSDVLTQQSN